MLRQSLNAFVCAAALGLAAPAFAADSLPPPPAPPMPSMNSGSGSSLGNCLYVRVDAGGAFHEDPSVSSDAVGAGGGFGGGSGTEAGGVSIEENVFFEGGIGCQLTEHMRVEITGGARLRQDLRDSFDTLDAELHTFTGFANVYYDITNYAGWTPYLGGGIGVAYHDLIHINAPTDAAPGDEFDFAWNVQAGLSYDFSENSKLDIGYRLVDLGQAVSGGVVPFKVTDLVTHEFRVGVRFHFGGW